MAAGGEWRHRCWATEADAFLGEVTKRNEGGPSIEHFA